MNGDLSSVIAGDFLFLRPLWLLGLLAIPPLMWWLRRLRLQRNVWRDAVDAHLLAHLLQGGQPTRAVWRTLFPSVAFGLAAMLAILALAGPSWRTESQPLWQDRNPLVIAVDLSYASLTADVQPSRLLQARAKIAHILRTRSGGQIALVAFADDAYTVSPLTDDAGNIALFLDAMSPDVMPRDGSRVDRAIEESARLLKRAGFGRGDILLMTDQAGGAAGSAAIDARKSGYRVSVLGLGTMAGGAYRDAKGGVSAAQLDADVLRKLADAGGGNYAPVAIGDVDLRALGVLQADRIDAAAAQGKRGSAQIDEGFWLLPVLLLLALLAFRRGVLAVLVLAAWLPWQPVAAADGALWQREDQRQHVRMQRGVDAYRGGDYAGAEAALRDLPGADAAYNRGNALAKQGRYDEAIAEYDRALTLQPGMPDAVENRRRVDAARKPPQSQPQHKPQDSQKDRQDKQQENKQNNRQQQPGQGKSQDSNQGSKPSPQQNPQQNPQQSQQQSQQQTGMPKPPDALQPPQTDRNGGKPAPPPGEPPDAKAQAQAQRDADAAQRERMRRAQAKPSQTPPATAGSRPQEAMADRERRIANEAWLRRVPDDPGGLLRAKFKLEEKRRRRESDR